MSIRNRISGKELRKSLNLLILAITFGMTFFVVTAGPPLTGFARALGAGDLVFGIIMAMPVVGGVLQVFGSYFLENTGKRKSMFLFFGFIHRLLWIPIALIPVFVPVGYNTIRIWAVTVLITLASSANSIVSVAFYSWMGALIPMEIKGRFFSRRTMICTISGAIAGLAVGWFLGKNPDITRYSVIFIIIALLGVADIICFIWIKDPPMQVPSEKISFIKLFTEPFGNKNYIKFISFISLWNFGVNFAGPFFNVYMLEYLGMDFFRIALFTQFASNIATVIFIRFWGRIVDKSGSKPVLTLCCSLIIMLPFLWCFATPQNFTAVIIIGFVGGILWPGVEMTSVNLSIWLAPEKNRSIYVATYTLITSVLGIALAFVCGGGFLELTRPLINKLDLPFVMGQRLNGFHVLFMLSGLIRLSSIVFLLPRVREEKSKSSRDVLRGIAGFLFLRKNNPANKQL